MARKQNPQTRFYEIKPGKSGWARVWITDDGCISIMSDYGNYGYWFGAPEAEFRAFLLECDDSYLGNKFAGGKKEFDGEGSADAVRERIRSLRREGRLSAADAREEWDDVPTSFDNEVDFSDWLHRTNLEDAYEYASYVRPSAVGHFLKQVWPLFSEALRAELARESTSAVPCEA